MKELEESHNVRVQWRSFELRPEGSPPISPEYRARIEAARPRFEAMVRAQHGIEINAGPFGINSRPALIGAKYAEAEGAGEAYHEAVFRAYWEQGKRIDDLEVLANIAESVGLEREAFLQALEDPAYELAVTADIEQAYRYGLSAVPALVFEDKYLVVGAQPYEALVQVTEKVIEERGPGTGDGGQ